MKLKKTFISFVALLFAVLAPFSSVFADSAGWQLKTSEWVHYNDTLGKYITGVDNAHVSGYVRVCNLSSGGRYFYVKEYDPSDKDDIYTYAYLDPGTCDSWDISSMVDGTNRQAEIYVQTTTKSSKFSIYD